MQNEIFEDNAMEHEELAYELSLGEQDLLDGCKAYQEGNYSEAVRLYQKAAAAGNVSAMSNLGYCYYYGRSIPTDKEQARICWEKAAALGDICAIYKLGDMFQNGDLPKDMVFAKLLYWRAFNLAQEYGTLGNYPDTCLRILKFCKEDCPPDLYADIAKDAVECFRERVLADDRFAGKLYEQALEIYQSIKE